MIRVVRAWFALGLTLAAGTSCADWDVGHAAFCPHGVSIDVDRSADGSERDIVLSTNLANSLENADGPLEIGDQVVVQVVLDEETETETETETNFAFTVVEISAELDDEVRLSPEGKERLGPGDVCVTSKVVPSLESQSGGFVLESLDWGNQDDLIILVPHGGDTQKGTSRAGELLLAATHGAATLWMEEGRAAEHRDREASPQWYIPCHDFSYASHPELNRLRERGHEYEYAVSLHLHDDSTECGGPESVLVAGTASDDQKDELATQIDAVLTPPDLSVFRPASLVRVKGEDESCAGTASTNVVNRFSRCGLQLSFHVDLLENETLLEKVLEVIPPLIDEWECPEEPSSDTN